MTQWQKVSQDVARESVAAALNQFVGRDKPYSFTRALAVLGCSEGSLKNWQAARSAPQHHEFMQMCAVFGSAFVNAWLAHLRMAGAHETDPAAVCPKAMSTAVARFGAEVTAALEDGHVDHREAAQMIPLARVVNLKTQQFLQKATHV